MRTLKYTFINWLLSWCRLADGLAGVLTMGLSLPSLETAAWAFLLPVPIERSRRGVDAERVGT